MWLATNVAHNGVFIVLDARLLGRVFVKSANNASPSRKAETTLIFLLASINCKSN